MAYRIWNYLVSLNISTLILSIFSIFLCHTLKSYEFFFKCFISIYLALILGDLGGCLRPHLPPKKKKKRREIGLLKKKKKKKKKWKVGGQLYYSTGKKKEVNYR
jgi:hypothetical protein